MGASARTKALRAALGAGILSVAATGAFTAMAAADDGSGTTGQESSTGSSSSGDWSNDAGSGSSSGLQQADPSGSSHGSSNAS